MTNADGHRDRVRKAYMENRLAGMATHNILELILFYAIPRKDTKPVARALSEHFGGDLNRIFNADIEELKSIDGIGESAAVLLTLFGEVNRAAAAQKNVGMKDFSDYVAVKEYCRNLLENQPNEKMLLITLDNRRRLINTHTVAEGTVNATAVEPRKLVQAALTDNASSVILVHNHPYGDFMPSPEDVQLTGRLNDLLRQIGIRFADHIIVGDNGSISMKNDIRYTSLFG